MFWHKKPYSIDDLPNWQKELLNNPLVDKDAFLKGKYLDGVLKQDEYSFKYSLGFHTKYHDSEQTSFSLHEVFEDFHYIDVSNPDYLSHYLLYDEGAIFMFENKCGRAAFGVYSYDISDDIFEFKNDKLVLTNKNAYLSDLNRGDRYCYNIRLKEFDFINEFISNLLSRPAKLTKNYEKYLNEIPKTSIKTLHKAFGEERYNK